MNEHPVENSTDRETPSEGVGGFDRRRLAKLAIAIFAVGVLSVLFFFGDALNRYLRFERTEIERVVNGEICRGWQDQAHGATDEFDQVEIQLWSPSTGFLVYYSTTVGTEEGAMRTTIWDRNGKLIQQSEFAEFSIAEFKIEPPWDWGFEDQEGPTAPPQFLDSPSSP